MTHHLMRYIPIRPECLTLIHKIYI